MQMKTIAILVSLLLGAAAHADGGVYLEPDDFVAQAFPDGPPTASVLWLDAELREELGAILGQPPRALRVRYWGAERRTAWILDEIGKDLPITLGVVVDGDAVEQLKVLVFREPRGWEIRHAFFTDQFRGVRLTRSGQLDQHIDGITGATLSVRATERVARAALLLHARTPNGQLNLARGQ